MKKENKNKTKKLKRRKSSKGRLSMTLAGGTSSC